MADINITTDFTEVNNLNTALKSTGSLFVKTVDSLVREEARAKRVTKKLAETTQANLDLIEKAEAIVADKVQQASDKREKARAREATRAEKEAQRIVAANEKIAKAEAKLAEEVARNQAISAQRSTAGLNQRLGITGTSATDAGAGFGALEGEIERLRLKYDQIYASSQLYEKSLMELNRANMLGVTSAKQHEAAVEALNQEYQNFQNGIGGVGNRFTQHVNQTSNGMNKFGVAAQQTGYQVSDFIVQVQGGTNPLVAFSQQATQLAGLLYLLPPAVQATTYSLFGFKIALSAAFAGVTILIPLLSMLAMAYFNSSKEADENAEATKKYQNALDGLKGSLQETSVALEALRRGVAPDDFFKAQLALEAVKEEFISLTTTEGIADSDPWGLAERLGELTKLRLELEKSIADLARVREEEQRLETATKRRANEVRNFYRQQKIDAEAQVKAQEDMNKKVAYGKNLFHGLAGETQSVSIYLSDALRSALGLASVNFSNVKTVADYLAITQGQMGRGLPPTGGPTFTYPLNADNRFGPSFERGGRGPIPAGVVNPTLEDLLGGTDDSGGTTGSAGAAPRDVVGDFQKQLDLERELVGTSEEYQKVRQALGDDFKTTNPEIVAGLVQQATEIERLIELENQRKDLMNTVKSSMEDAFMSMVDGTKSAKEAFKSMAAEIIKELYRVLVVQRLVNSISGALMPAAGPAGSSAPPPRPPGLATGGSMMANRAYMVGENGPELVIPRHSGTVVNAKQTASAMGGGGGFTQNLSITVTGSDSAMVRTEIAKMIPQITNATKAAVIDAKQRGGQMSAAFR